MKMCVLIAHFLLEMWAAQQRTRARIVKSVLFIILLILLYCMDFISLLCAVVSL